MNNVKIIQDENCYYMVQDLQGLDTYDRAKTIVQFCDKETKEFEKVIDRAILDIFEKYGINVPNTTKSVLNRAFDYLNDNGIDIKIANLYTKNPKIYYSCELVKQTNWFTIYIEDNRFIQCGAKVEEIKL